MKYQVIHTYPEKNDFDLFQKVSELLYPSEILQQAMGSFPTPKYLRDCIVLLKNDIPLGRLAIHYNHQVKYNGQPTAQIGSYECVNDEEVSGRLLQYAFEEIKSGGYHTVIGPMDGSTFNGYRFSVQNKHRNFFMEPYHHAYYNEQFMANGFEVIARYDSKLDDAVQVDKNRLERAEQLFKVKGAVMRHLYMDSFEDELRKIAHFTNEAFKNNFLFTPVDEDEFVGKYMKFKSYINPSLVWMVEDKSSTLHALMFAVEDFLSQQRDTLIIKTLARLPDSPFRGIGSYLVLKVNQLAVANGYQKIIHAFMKEENESKVMSERLNAKPYKQYLLYAKSLM
ncbi:MAG: hypothetical protein MI922_28760 [Bacteroidales bacterium]|nr:hypothetical protein [Bacteroidales bacterium]